MRIVIVGAGKVGTALVEQLVAENHDVTVIEKQTEPLNNVVNKYDVMGICGNGASFDTLDGAGVAGADLLIATASSDEINILVCLLAKQLGIHHTIARIRNPEYEKPLRMMRETLGLSMIINPEKSTAHEIARVLRFPAALKVETFSRGTLELVAYRIPEKSRLDGVCLADLYKSLKVKVLICTVERGRDIFIPDGEFVLRAGDHIHLTASPKEIEGFFRQLGVFKAKAGSVILAGGGRISYYLAVELLSMGMQVKIIEKDEKRCQELSELLPRALIIAGDATDSELLSEESLNQADAFVALTGLDEANILLSVYALRESHFKVIAKINRQTFIDLATFGEMVDSVVSPRVVTAELIVQYVRGMQNSLDSKVQTLHRLVNGRVEALEFAVPKSTPFLGVPIKDLPLRPNLLIAGITRSDGKVIIPSGSDCFRAGDNVVIVTHSITLNDFGDILRQNGTSRGGAAQ